MIKTISQRLRNEIPGLRGFGETNLKNMRIFYEAWNNIESKSSVATDDLHILPVVDADEATQLPVSDIDTIR